MKFKPNSRLLKKRIEKLFEDSLARPYVRLDARAVKAVSRLLSPDERDRAEFPASVLSGGKLILVCDRRVRIEEILWVDVRNPRKLYRARLGLKGKEHTRDA